MSSSLIQNPLDNIVNNSRKNLFKNKSKKTNSENKENIPSNIKPQKLIEEDQEKPEKNFYQKIKKNIKKRDKEKYEQKLKENTMRNELDKISNETERLKQEYEEKSSKYYLFENPQFKKFIKNVEMQLLFLLGLSGLLSIFSIALIASNSAKEIGGFSIACLIITIMLVANNLILIACVKMGLLNDTYLSKAFRMFVIMESLLLITSLCFNITSLFLNKKISHKFWIFSLLILIILDLIFVVKKCLNLFVESCLILLGKKTEYSVLISKENQGNSRTNTSLNFSLDKTTNDLLDEGINKNIEEEKENNFKVYNFFNKFHYSVSSDRKKDYDFNHFKKI